MNSLLTNLGRLHVSSLSHPQTYSSTSYLSYLSLLLPPCYLGSPLFPPCYSLVQPWSPRHHTLSKAISLVFSTVGFLNVPIRNQTTDLATRWLVVLPLEELSGNKWFLSCMLCENMRMYMINITWYLWGDHASSISGEILPSLQFR